MKTIDKILLNQQATIREALQVIDKGAMKVAVVVDDNEKIIGILTDGDIRRGLLNGMVLENSIESIIHSNPVICQANDTKETIIQLALSKKIYQIPVVDNTGRVVGIHEIDELLRTAPKTNKVVLMAGGLGTRLGELTKHTPKPMLKVGEKPILETIIENFAKYGFVNVIISVNYLSHIIEDYFGDGSRFGVSIQYILEKEPLGTAGALSLMKKELTEPFFVMNGDLLTNVNCEHIYGYHRFSQAVATMCVGEYDFQVPYGVINLENGCMLSIDEKPIHKFFVSAGIYMLSPVVLELVPDNEYFDMPSLFKKIIYKGDKVATFPIHEYWLDIGRINDYERANSEYHEVF